MPMYRPRLLDQLKRSAAGISRKGKRHGRDKVREAARGMAEYLETRVMLTTITTAGPTVLNPNGTPATFTYESVVQTYPDLLGSVPDGRFVTIQQSGDTQAEYVGAYLDELGATQLTDLPGVFGSGNIVNGGFGGEQGTQLYGQDEITDPIRGAALSYNPYSPTGTTALRIDALASYVNANAIPGPTIQEDQNGTQISVNTSVADGNGILYGVNVVTSTTVPVIQIIEFYNSNLPTTKVGGVVTQGATTAPTLVANSPTPHGEGIVVADISLPVDPNNPNSLQQDGIPLAATAPAAVTAAAFNPIDGRLYFVVVGNGPTKLNEVYSVDVTAGSDGNIPGSNTNDYTVPGLNDRDIRESLIKSQGQFGAIPATQASAGTAAVAATTNQVSAITFHQINATSAELYAFEVYTAPVKPSLNNPTGGAGAATPFLSTYRYTAAAGAAGLQVAGVNGRAINVLYNGIGETTQITGLSFENDQSGVNPTTIYASSSSFGPATGGSGTNGGAGTTGALLFQVNLTEPNGGAYPAIEIAQLANPAGAFGTTSILGNDIQDLVWEPDAVDPISGVVGAFVGTDATANELAVISTSPRPAGAYLFSIYVGSGSLDNSIIAVASPADSEYNVLTGIPAQGAPSGALSPYAGNSGDVLVAATGLKTADGFSRAPGGTGYAYLGLKGAGLQPITNAFTPGFGLIPAGTVQAGLETAPGVEMDKFLFGGTVTGNVDFQGNAYAFYSGWLITGNSQGFSGSTYVETLNGAPTSGDYSINVTTANGSQNTSGTALTTNPPDLTFDSPASDVQLALQDVGIINAYGANAVVVSGPNGGPYTIQFAAGLGTVTLSLYSSTLAPAGTPPVTFTELTPASGLEATNDLRNVWVQSDAGGEPTPGFVADASFDVTDINGDFNSNLQPVIGGHIDQFRAVLDFQGDFTVENAAQGFGINDEIDPLTGAPYVQQKLLSYAGSFANGDIVEGAALFNDAFASPQYLGALSTSNPVVTLDGVLNGTVPVVAHAGDNVNYYAVALLAGQTITTQLDSGNLLDIGVFDPDNRLIATDYHVDQGSGVYGNPTQNQPFQFKTTMPGVYRFAISPPEAQGLFDGLVLAGGEAYTLRVGDADNPSTGAAIPVNGQPGDIAFGGLYVGTFSAGSVSTAAPDGTITLTAGVSSVEVVNGDLGAVHADVSVTNVDAIVDVGNLRDMDAADIGTKTGTAANGYALVDPVSYSVPVGGIGLIRATDASPTTGSLAFEPLYADPNVLDPTTHTDLTPAGNFVVGQPVGTTIQVVDAASTLAADLSANYAIGTIRSGDQDVAPANTFAVNPNNNQAIAGRIDLIDCTGNFGDLGSGGPAITTGPNGDVGFINVGGQVFQDLYFGGGAPTSTSHDPGQAVTLTDDGGAIVTLTPVGTLTPNPAYNASAPVPGVSQFSGPALTLTTYGIRGSGGVVIINVTVSSGGSLDVTSGGNAQSRVAEITNITIQAGGQVVLPTATAPTTVTNASTGVVSNVSNQTIVSPTLSGSVPTGGNTAPNSNIVPFELDPASANPALTVYISGSNNVNVFDVTGYTDGTDTTLTNFTSIINATGGEIVNVNAASIGVLKSGGPIGVPVTAVPADLYPFRVISSTFPFDQQHYGIVVTGNGGGNGGIVQLVSSSAIGNVLVTGGSIGSIIADAGHANSPNGVFAGIDGPIVTAGFYQPTVAAQIQYVDIGQGIESSGTGIVGFAGIYSAGVIGLVTNSRPGAEIRGTIVSNTELNAVELQNASIINASIAVIANFDATDQIPAPTIYLSLGGTQENPVWAIGQITISGDGGIIGAVVESDAIGPVLVHNGGYGVFFSDFLFNDGSGEEAPVTASGYGIRGSLFEGGASLYGLNATGNGSLISTNTFDSALFVNRQTTTSLTAFNPYSGLLPSQLDDLDANLQTGTADPNIPGRTDTGAIEDTSAIGQRNLGTVVAQTIREVVQVDAEGAPLLPNPTTVSTLIPGEGGFGTSFDFANSIGSVHARGAINGLELTSGKVASFNALSIARTGITVAGTIVRMLIRGDYGKPINSGEVLGSQVAAGDSFIQAVGPHGTIGHLTITGNVYGTIFATGSIFALTVYGSIRGNVTVLGESRGLAVGTLHVGSFLDQSSLDITGSVGSIIANGGFGVAGDTLTITGNLGSLQVGALRSNTNNSLGMALTVDGSIGSINVRGHIDGSIAAGGNITRLSVSSDGSTANLINGPITANGSIGTVALTNGNVVSTVSAAGSIKTVSLKNGSVDPGASFQSANGSISNFKITGSTADGLYGSLLAPHGVHENIQVSGNIGDGVDPAIITASTGSTFHVYGSILSNTSITVAGSLDLLQVDGNIYTGAVISAHPLKKQKIKGTNTGSITIF